jgi:hypothetical protein
MIKSLIGAIRLAPVKSLMAFGLAACMSLSGSANAASVDISTGIHTHTESGRQIDNIWTVNVAGDSRLETLLPGFPVPPYIPDSAASKWLVPALYGQQNAPGNTDYEYSTKFTISADDIAAGATLTGRYLSDNAATGITLTVGMTTIALSPLNPPPPPDHSFTAWTTLNPYAFTTAGEYTLTFTVHNNFGPAGNPTGFRFEGNYTAAVPEPASLVMGALSTLALGGLSWKRRVARHG